MSSDNILANFILRLNPNILILLYEMSPTNLDKTIMKTKMIEIGQKNVLEILQINAKMMQLETENQVL